MKGNLHFKIARLILGGKFYVSKSIGLAYSWKEIYVGNLQKVFTETALRVQFLLKLSHAYTLSIQNEEIQDKS